MQTPCLPGTFASSFGRFRIRNVLEFKATSAVHSIFVHFALFLLKYYCILKIHLCDFEALMGWDVSSSCFTFRLEFTNGYTALAVLNAEIVQVGMNVSGMLQVVPWVACQEHID
jgi:hypothetical protein